MINYSKRKQSFIDCPSGLADFEGKQIIESDVMNEEGNFLPAVLHYVKLFNVKSTPEAAFSYEGELCYECSLINPKTNEISDEIIECFDTVVFDDIREIKFFVIGQL